MEEEQNCCEFLFNSKPIFDYPGTCYTTNKPIVEKTASMYSTITIWLNSLPMERQISIDLPQWDFSTGFKTVFFNCFKFYVQ